MVKRGPSLLSNQTWIKRAIRPVFYIHISHFCCLLLSPAVSACMIWEVVPYNQIPLLVTVLALNILSEVLIALTEGVFPSFLIESKGSWILKQGRVDHYICVKSTCCSGLGKNSVFPLNVQNFIQRNKVTIRAVQKCLVKNFFFFPMEVTWKFLAKNFKPSPSLK